MQRADTLTVVHNDDYRDTFTDVRYCLDRHGVRVHTGHGEIAFTEVLTVFATVKSGKPATAVAAAAA